MKRLEILDYSPGDPMGYTRPSGLKLADSSCSSWRVTPWFLRLFGYKLFCRTWYAAALCGGGIERYEYADWPLVER